MNLQVALRVVVRALVSLLNLESCWGNAKRAFR